LSTECTEGTETKAARQGIGLSTRAGGARSVIPAQAGLHPVLLIIQNLGWTPISAGVTGAAGEMRGYTLWASSSAGTTCICHTCAGRYPSGLSLHAEPRMDSCLRGSDRDRGRNAWVHALGSGLGRNDMHLSYLRRQVSIRSFSSRRTLDGLLSPAFARSGCAGMAPGFQAA
jgi:hypothetical protein